MPYPPVIYFNNARLSRTSGGFSIELLRSNNQSEVDNIVGVLYMNSSTAFQLSLALEQKLSDAVEEMCAGSNLKPDVLRKALEDKSQKHVDLLEILRQPEPVGFQAPQKKKE